MSLNQHEASRLSLRIVAAYILLSNAIALSGCQTYQAVMGPGTAITVTEPSHYTRSGFLSDYSRLKPSAAVEGIECWRDMAVDLKAFDNVMVSSIVVSLAASKPTGGNQTIDPTDLKALTDYFHHSLVTALAPQMPVVDVAGPKVLVMKIALTDLVPTGVMLSMAGTLTPYGFVAEAGSGVATGRPVGSTPYLGEAGMEIQFRDGASGAVIGECRDTEIGRKFATDVNSGAVGSAQTWASGYLNSFQQWTYAKNAFDKWSSLLAKRLAALRGIQPKA
ncbi:DUF3313 domain-containing protein [Methylotetracoccus oryzae]|uniref:DUF3313 domain-containing protein n=1 Tax=Methylotetracoccus oryzae TaxID=1919059 RepID=UPI00111B7FD1|nr:DUF3313 domain-containing protein [Methylotetracoccus oryzae]